MPSLMTKGKQATKGQKQIYDENKQTISFYTYMSGIAMILYLTVLCIFWPTSLYSTSVILGVLFCGSVYLFSIQMLKYMAKPVFSSAGQLMDGGTDLNMESGFAENFKDLIIITSAIQVLTLISNYFWIAWLFVPGRAFYMLWVNILGPWFFAPAPESDQQVDEKKQRKLERKMRRSGQ